MKDLVILNDQGYYWPKNDGAGQHNREGACWWGLTQHIDIPDRVSKYVENRRVLIQAGGNCGLYVKKYAGLFDLVYTFEPDPVNFYCLNLNVTEPNVLKYQACLGEKHEGVSIGNFMLDVGATHVTGAGALPTLRIDDLTAPACDLIHLDIEGYELHALKGATETINKFKPVIALEFCRDWAARYSTTLADIENHLAELGYEFFEDVPNAQGDKIYMHKDQVNAARKRMSKTSKEVKIYDCFPFFKELDILELRLEELYDDVDYFVIVEATSTHSGLDKPLYLQDNWDRFAKYHDKIRYIVVDDLPKDPDPWVAENYQRNCITRGIDDAGPNDLILISDCDEIARPEVLEALREDENDYDIYVLNVALFHYRFNYLKINPPGAWRQHNIVVTRKRALVSPQHTRNLDFHHPRIYPGMAYPDHYNDDKMCVIEHGGWHFTYFGDTEFAREKIKSFAHYRETDNPLWMDTLSVDDMIKNKCALLGPAGEERFEYVKVNEYFPKTILNNLEKYEKWIIPDAEHVVEDFYTA